MEPKRRAEDVVEALHHVADLARQAWHAGDEQKWNETLLKLDDDFWHLKGVSFHAENPYVK